MNPIRLRAGLWATGSVMRAYIVLPAPTRLTAVMLDSPRTTPRAGQYDGTQTVSRSETLPRDCSRMVSFALLSLPPMGRQHQRMETVILPLTIFQETPEKTTKKKGAPDFCCSPFWLLLSAWVWPVAADLLRQARQGRAASTHMTLKLFR